MKQRLVFILPSILLLAFLAFKPPAVGTEQGEVIVTPEATVSPLVKPHIRDFEDDEDGPEHFDDHRDRTLGEPGDHMKNGDEHHERPPHDEEHSDDDWDDDLDEDSDDEDD
jgi:hypothetical protein